MMRRTAMKPGAGLKRSPIVRKSPMPSTGMLSVQSNQRTAPAAATLIAATAIKEHDLERQ